MGDVAETTSEADLSNGHLRSPRTQVRLHRLDTQVAHPLAECALGIAEELMQITDGDAAAARNEIGIELSPGSVQVNGIFAASAALRRR